MNIHDFGRRTIVLRGLATLVLVNSLLLAPGWVLVDRIAAPLAAAEAGVLLGLVMMLPRARWSYVVTGVLAFGVVAVAVLGLADTTARLSLARPLNLYLDVRLLSAVANLLQGGLGEVRGAVVMVLGGLLTVGLVPALAFLLAGLLVPPHRPRWRVAGAVVLVVSLVAIPARRAHRWGAVIGAPIVQLVQEQSVQLTHMLEERERFGAEMAAAPSSYENTPELLAGLGGRTVVLAFIESYGMSALSDDRYAPVILPKLDAMDEALSAAGLVVASGTLDAPSQGGMSWLGHGAVLSGLWLENQLRYDLLMASSRETLVDDFSAAGYRTVAVMPAITLAWPEGERLGYDEIYAEADIAYQGPALNWVTMPDQFTWSFLEESIRASGDERPLFVEVGLISSHAPWTPILEVLEWNGVGDGSVFSRWAEAEESPEELWLDTDRVREHYALAVGYSVDVLASYAARYVDQGTVLIAMGDHQPAPLITGDDASRAVPVHVITSDPTLLEPFLDWGFVTGTRPDVSRGAHRMSDFRDWFVSAFSTNPLGTQP